MSISRNRRGRFKSVSRSTKRHSKSKSLDVTTKAQMHKLQSMLKKTNLTVVLVYADWCGHCHTYKDTVWKQLEGLANKKVGLAKLNEKVLKESPLSSAKINGYPSVLVVGKDGKPAEFKDESTGEPTNAMPNARDVEMMKGLVTGASDQASPNISQYPKTIYIGKESNVSKKAEETPAELEVESKSLLNATPADDLEPEPESGNVSAYNPSDSDMSSSGNAANSSANSGNAANSSANSANMATENASTNASANSGNMAAENASAPPENPEDNASAILVNSESPVSSKVLPPSASDDLLDTNIAVSGPENSSQLGGSLYMALLESAKATAPAALLTAAAVMKSRSRRSKKSGKRKTRR